MAGLYIKDIQSSAADFGKGSQRDLLDAITMVDAKETPFMAMVPKVAAPINALYEWPVDIAEAPDDNAVKECQIRRYLTNAVNFCQWDKFA